MTDETSYTDTDATEIALSNRYIAIKNPFRYRSYYYDVETNLYYLNNRYYDPETGRFITIDDISILSEAKDLINGLNLYSYCSNNPVIYTDDSGNAWWDWLIGIISAVVTVGVVVGLFALASVTAGAGAVLLGAAIKTAAVSLGFGAGVGGLKAAFSQESFAGGVVGGALRGLGIGVALGLGMLTGGGSVAVLPAVLGTLSFNYIMGNIAYFAENSFNGLKPTSSGAMISGVMQMLTGIFAFATGAFSGALGIYNDPTIKLKTVLKDLFTGGLSSSIWLRIIFGSTLLKASFLWPISNVFQGIQQANR